MPRSRTLAKADTRQPTLLLVRCLATRRGELLDVLGRLWLALTHTGYDEHPQACPDAGAQRCQPDKQHASGTLACWCGAKGLSSEERRDQRRDGDERRRALAKLVAHVRLLLERTGDLLVGELIDRDIVGLGDLSRIPRLEPCHDHRR